MLKDAPYLLKMYICAEYFKNIKKNQQNGKMYFRTFMVEMSIKVIKIQQYSLKWFIYYV